MSEQNNIIKITIIIELPLNTIANLVYHMRHLSATANDDQLAADDLATKLALDFNTHIANRLSTAVTWTQLEWAVYDSVAQEFNTTAVSNITGATGTALGGMTPHIDAGIVTFFTSVAKRQGRKYIPGLDETQITDSQIGAAMLVDLALWGAAFDSNLVFDGVTYNQGVFSVPLGYLPFNNTVAANDITGSQIRRRPGRGI